MEEVVAKTPYELAESLIEREEMIPVEGTTTTVCILTLKGGWCAVGKSACVDRSKYNAELGAKYAREDALKNATEAVAFWLLISDAVVDALT